MKYLLLPLCLMAILFACQSPSQQADPVSLIDVPGYSQHIQILASDEFEGRMPASPGEEKTIAYLADAFTQLGAQPGNGDSYFQPVSLGAITTDPNTQLIVSQGGKRFEYAYGTEAMLGTKRVAESIELEASELVFVGYGIVAPEFGWNDYEGLDMEGKTALIIVNDPGYITKDSSLFTGKAMTYYGRWTYKYEEAARQGAAGALIIHQTGPASYPWEVVKNGWSGKQFDQVSADGNADRCAMEGWVQESVAKDLFDRARLSMDEMLAAAAQPGFKWKMMNQEISVSLRNTLEKSTSNNVIAKIPGKTRPDEYIIYTAHWDHFGIDTTLEGDQIYNGAQDNATGTAALLELAEAYQAAGGSDRTIVFMAVTAEEQGLIGSAYYASNPVYPLGQTVAVINMDALNTLGQMKDIMIIGYGNSELDQYVEKYAAAQNRTVREDPTPEKGSYFRSDHFSFAKQGVPALNAKSGINHVKHGSEWTLEQQKDYTTNRYHKPGDNYDPNWDLSGAVQDLQMLFQIGLELANNEDWPNWHEGVAFKAMRDAQRE